MGYSVVSNDLQKRFSDIKEEEFWEIYNLCKDYTMTSVERMYSLYSSVNYVLENNIEGDFVECGVWRGGSSMLMAKMLKNRSISDRKIYLYDTYEGMSEPTKKDVSIAGDDAEKLMEKEKNNKEESVWCLADLADVKQNMRKTGFAEESLVFVKGKVEDTLTNDLPMSKIAILRLDTDWYESTKHELNILYPILSQNGVLLIDDYGHWQGCRQAVDEYFQEHKINPLMSRVDYTGRVMIKNKIL